MLGNSECFVGPYRGRVDERLEPQALAAQARLAGLVVAPEGAHRVDRTARLPVDGGGQRG
jgi:hypothetical protein